MVTTKPFSTVSYNTKVFLENVLKTLTSAHKIEFWAFVHHMPEDDEGGKKEHFHVYIEPSKRIDTSLLRDEFKELDVTHPEDPLCCLPFRSSKFQDWFMYACHDREYLAQKAEKRRFHYSRDDFVVSDQDAFNYLIKTIDLSELSPVRRLKQFHDAGMTFSQAVSQGLVPLPQFTNYKKVWDILSGNVDETDRGGRKGHDQDQDQPKRSSGDQDHDQDQPKRSSGDQDHDQDQPKRSSGDQDHDQKESSSSSIFSEFVLDPDYHRCCQCGDIFLISEMTNINDEEGSSPFYICRKCSQILFA